MKKAESLPNRLKTLLEKEKFLITSSFSSSLIVFKRLILQTHKNQGLFGKGLIDVLTLHCTMTSFDNPLGRTLLKNIVGKGENAGNQHFLLLPQFFFNLSETDLIILSTFILLFKISLSFRKCKSFSVQ